jgi:hypothetical protein
VVDIMRNQLQDISHHDANRTLLSRSRAYMGRDFDTFTSFTQRDRNDVGVIRADVMTAVD